MKIAIIVAMQKEFELLLNIINNPVNYEINGFVFCTGSIDGNDVVAMTCGIGKVNAAMGTLTLINEFAPDVVINSGVAGGTGSDAGILDVVLASRIGYHDVWCGPGTRWGQAHDCPPFFVSPDAEAIAEKMGVKTGLLASGDIFVTRSEDLDHILSLYPDCMAVDMESAAVAQVCHAKGVPMYCLRVISDKPGSDNLAQYENFWSDAPQQTFKGITALIQLLSK